MRHAVIFAATILVACQTVAADKPLFGTWRGTSICTAVRPACHDEIAVYHIAPSSKAGHVAMTMNKVVDGKEVEMGPGALEYAVDYKTRTLVHAIQARDGTRGEFRFTWMGNTMTGTLVDFPGERVIRNIKLEKE
ncbi:MAG TPA: hypothetical protein VM733_04880 [Thermoanaerobaculia bacterium]|nr:hypothetical protein [Thermoanaerobaculia bacterium]